MRSFCAGIASSSLGIPRGLGDEDVLADRKRKRLNYLDSLPDSSDDSDNDSSATGSWLQGRRDSLSSSSSKAAGAKGKGAASRNGGGASRASAPRTRNSAQASQSTPCRMSSRSSDGSRGHEFAKDEEVRTCRGSGSGSSGGVMAIGVPWGVQ